MRPATRILVTGGAGYVGSHACKTLAASGYEPVTYDDLTSGHADFVRWGPFIQGDLADTDRLARAMADWRPAAVIHFAASSDVGESVRDPLKYYRNNIGGTASLLAAMAAHGVRDIVFSSTCAVYGVPEVAAIAEDQPQRPISPYGRTKQAVELMLADVAYTKQIRFVSLRYFNAAGADPDGAIGERHQPESHLIPLAIRSANGGKPLSVFGTDFPTADGTAVRDYIHVDDLATAHVAALAYLNAGGASDFFNLGVGRGYSVRNVIDTLRGLDVPVHSIDAPRRAGDPAILVADAAKARAVLKWKPRYDRLDELLRTAVAWHRANG